MQNIALHLGGAMFCMICLEKPEKIKKREFPK